MNHLVEVAHLVTEATAGTDIDLTIAAVLHDAIEDARITAAQIEALFGLEVAQLVLEVTDDKSLPPATRKRLQVESTPHKSPKAKMIKLADTRQATFAPSTSHRLPGRWQASANICGGHARSWPVFEGINARLEDVFDEAATERRVQVRPNH